MYPILFEGNTTSFDSYGLGVLSDCVSCVVSEERNGAYELEMTYPVDGLHFSQITHSRIIYAKPSDGGNNQAFRIYKITKPRNGIVTVNAEHISYQLNFIPTGGAEATTCQNALNGLKNNAYESCPFTFYSNNTKAGTYTQNAPASIRSRLGGTQGSILDVFGGEYEWDNFTVKNLADRGSDNGVTLRYGKNITDIKQEENIENTVTGVCPYWANEETLVTLPEKVLHSSTASLYPFQRTITLDCSNEFENAPSVSDLRQYATNYMTLNNIGYPKVSISVSFVALWQTEEYKDVAPLERVSLCDYVHIYYEKLGIEGVAKVIKTEYDVLLERYNKIDLGDAKSTLCDTIRGEIQDETRDKVTSQAMMNAVERATNLITGNEGGHLRFIYDENGLPQEQVIMDTEDIDTAHKVWRWNLSGLGFSSTGYDGTYGTAITMNGEINADFITTGKLSAVDIEAVNDQTGYYTKINTSSGGLTWKMANSELNANGNYISKGTYHTGIINGGVYSKYGADPTPSAFDAGVTFHYSFNNISGNVMKFESEHIAFKGRIHVKSPDDASNYFQTNENGSYVGTTTQGGDPFSRFTMNPTYCEALMTRFTYEEQKVMCDGGGYILYVPALLLKSANWSTTYVWMDSQNQSVSIVTGAPMRRVINGLCT